MVGIDDSPAMLADAAPHARAGVRFELGDIGAWGVDDAGDGDGTTWCSPTPACSGCPTIRACSPGGPRRSRRGGQLAVQVPTNADHPSHLLAAEVAATEPFASAFDGPPPPDPVAANVLRPGGLRDAAARSRVRRAARAAAGVRPRARSTAAVVEWVRGTTLTRFFKRLPAELHEPFVDAYRRALLARLGEHAPYFYPFKRILMWGRR